MELTRAEAIRIRPQGWDVFKRGHLMYMEGINRKFAVAYLNYDAYKAFSDTILLKRSEDLIDEEHKVDEFTKYGKSLFRDEFPFPETQLLFSHSRTLEYLKIGCGFELSLKSKLLHHRYIIHKIDKSDAKYNLLAAEQRKRPIEIDELTDISDYMFNGTHNVLPGITSQSLQFSTILDKPKYRKVCALNSKTYDIISAYRDLRNLIHLTYASSETSVLTNMSWKDKIQFIRKYIQERIISVNRHIVENYKLHSMFKIEEWQPDLISNMGND